MNTLKQILFAILLLGGPLLAQTDKLDRVVVQLPAGSGVVVSSDGFVAVPSKFLTSSSVVVDGLHQRAEVALTAPEAPFGLLKLEGGPYDTLSLGDCTLIKDGDQVLLATARGTESVEAGQLFNDVVTNHQVLILHHAYDDTLLGTPVLNDEMEVVALITGPEPDDVTKSRATSVQELKLLLFDEKWPPFVQRPYAALSDESISSEQSTGSELTQTEIEILEWEFPFGFKTNQKPGDLLRMKRWQQSTGFGANQIAEPVVDSEGRLYVTTLDGTVYCLDVENQQLVWQNDLGPESVVFFAPSLQEDPNLLIVNGSLGITSRTAYPTDDRLADLLKDVFGRVNNRVSTSVGQIYSFDPQTGGEMWRLSSRFIAAPILEGDTLYLSGLGMIGAIDAQTGRYRWRLDNKPRKSRPLWHSLQVQEQGVLYGIRVPIEIQGGGDTVQAVSLKGADGVEVIAIDARDGTELWSSKLKNTNNLSQPLAPRLQKSDGVLHAIVHDRAFGLNPQNGELRYSYLRSNRGAPGLMVVQKGIVFGADSQGWYALQAETGELLWRHEAPQPETAPRIENGIFYGMGPHRLVALDAETGEKRWEQRFEHRLSGRPAIRGEYLYCVSAEGKIWRITLP